MKQIEGEYPRVFHWSNQKDLLEKAHNTPCSIEQAKSLIVFVCEHYKIPIPEIKFRLKSPGRASQRRNRIILPKPSALGLARIGYLRVGIVLHEVAHLQARYHGRDFVNQFDELLILTQELWRNK